jgi:DNA-binding response OmpR family regulator
MNILIAEDDPVSRLALDRTLRKWGHHVVVTANGTEAWDVLRRDDSPPVAILDWMMPGLDGVEVCRLARQRVPQDDEHRPLYLILLTARDRKEDLVAGLEAGADDYIIKPFDRDELRARLEVGLRMVGLQHRLAGRVHELHEALQKVKLLQGLLPICSYCKRIRDDQNYWQQVEGYIGAHSEARFSHAICPTCYEQVVQPQIDALHKISCKC